DWQLSYNYMKNSHERGNEIRPCFIRDHHEKARDLILKTSSTPAGTSAAESLWDNDYIQAMKEYDLEISSQLDPIWEEHYRDA
ncbi:MAG: hypothetical protein KAW14_09340, partial [Candidatus Aegiribacteria sp.]|nr:hypothetical protein [Candidatus Aegiribacteria sp.]